jgi:hypothetical protein
MGMHRLEEGHVGDPVAAEQIYMAVLFLLVHMDQVRDRIINLYQG